MGKHKLSVIQSPPPNSPESELELMIERLLKSHEKQYVSFIGKLDAIYTDLNSNFEALNTHVKKLDTQVAQTADFVRRQEGFLPSKTDMNPR